MAAESTALPGEYREDHVGASLPGRLRGVEAVTAILAVIFLAILIDLTWKRTRGNAAAPPEAKAVKS